MLHTYIKANERLNFSKVFRTPRIVEKGKLPDHIKVCPECFTKLGWYSPMVCDECVFIRTHGEQELKDLREYFFTDLHVAIEILPGFDYVEYNDYIESLGDYVIIDNLLILDRAFYNDMSTEVPSMETELVDGFNAELDAYLFILKNGADIQEFENRGFIILSDDDSDNVIVYCEDEEQYSTAVSVTMAQKSSFWGHVDRDLYVYSNGCSTIIEFMQTFQKEIAAHFSKNHAATIVNAISDCAYKKHYGLEDFLNHKGWRKFIEDYHPYSGDIFQWEEQEFPEYHVIDMSDTDTWYGTIKVYI